MRYSVLFAALFLILGGAFWGFMVYALIGMDTSIILCPVLMLAGFVGLTEVRHAR